MGRFYGRRVNYLEIGVQDGGSLETARKLFDPASAIIGMDVDPRCRLMEQLGVADRIITSRSSFPTASSR